MGSFDQLTEQKLQQAREQGAFERLEGSGSPLAQQPENPYEDPTMRLAYGALRRGGYSLPWVEEWRDLEDAQAQAQAKLTRAWLQYQAGLARQQPAGPLEADWQAALARFRATVADHNRQLLSYNLRVPVSQFQRVPFEAEAAIAQVQATPLDLPPLTAPYAAGTRWLRQGLPLLALLLSAAALALLGLPAIPIVLILLLVGLTPLWGAPRPRQ